VRRVNVGVKGWFNFLAFVFDILWSHVKKCWFNFGHFAGLTFFSDFGFH